MMESTYLGGPMLTEATQTYRFRCDHCRRTWLGIVAPAGTEVTEMRERILEHRWVIRQDKDYCPRCRYKIGAVAL